MRQEYRPFELVDPVIGLKRKLSAPGGISREVALSCAHDKLQEQRNDATEDLVKQILALRQIGAARSSMQLSKTEVNELLSRLDEILNVAGTYKISNVVTTASFLSEILSAKPWRLNKDVLNTFIHVMHLFTLPGGTHEEDGLLVLKQLRHLFDPVEPVQRGRGNMLRTD